MRKLKFRVYDKTGGAWLNDKITISLDKGLLFDNKPIKDVLKELSDNIEINQYTGLDDKNGKEIYEGDIISVNGKYPKVIRWSEYGFSFCLINISDLKHQSCIEIEQIPSRRWFTNSDREIEIIGNIYENKELLK